jgi:hypothetical protein
MVITIKVLRNLVKITDQFPLNFRFFIKDQEQKKTLTGGILSILMIIITIGVIVKNYLSFISWEDPIVRHSVEYIGTKRSENFSLADMEMIHSLLNYPSFEPIDSNITVNSSENVYIELSDPFFFSSSNIGYFYNCTDANIKKLDSTFYNDYFKSFYYFRNGLCFLNSNDSIQIGGNPIQTQEEAQTLFYFSVDVCSIKELKGVCLNSSKLEKIQYIYSFTIKNNYPNMSNPKGYDQFFDNYNNFFPFSNDINIDIKLVKNVISSDLNPIYDLFPNKESIFFSFSDISVTTAPSKNPSLITIKVKMKLDSFQNIYKRSYTKIDEALAAILSIYSSICLVCQALVNVFEYGTLDHFFMKKLYYFAPISKQSEVVNFALSKHIKTINGNIVKVNLNPQENIQADDIVSSKSPRDILIKQNVTENKMIDKDYKITKIRINEVESSKPISEWKNIINGYPPERCTSKMILFDLCHCLRGIVTEDVKKIVMAREYLVRDFNIINVLRTLHEFEKIKRILFHLKQIEMLDICPSRIIDMNNPQLINNNLSNYIDKIKTSINLKEKIGCIYEELLNSDNDIDKRLVSLVNSINI